MVGMNADTQTFILPLRIPAPYKAVGENLVFETYWLGEIGENIIEVLFIIEFPNNFFCKWVGMKPFIVLDIFKKTKDINKTYIIKAYYFETSIVHVSPISMV